ncbi:MAG: RNA polymerase sigma-70 factor [Bacteroidales bacterium]
MVKELSKGNISAFNSLYREYSGRLYRFALGYLKSAEEAEELVQEVFTIIWEKRSTLKEELSFKSFLFTIAFNIIRKHFRTRGHLEGYFRSRPTDENYAPVAEEVNYASLLDYINSLVEQMPDRRRQVFRRSRMDGRSIQEIAEELNISHKTVENHLSDALRFVRSHLNRENFPLVLFFFLFIN